MRIKKFLKCSCLIKTNRIEFCDKKYLSVTQFKILSVKSVVFETSSSELITTDLKEDNYRCQMQRDD